MPVPSAILNIVEAMKQQIINKSLGNQTTSSAQEPKLSATPPQNVDYSKEIIRPEITTLPSNMKFEATPNRSSAMMTALGLALQDTRNLEAAKQGMAMEEYKAKMQDAVDLNKMQSQEDMRQRYHEASPDTQLARQQAQQSLDTGAFNLSQAQKFSPYKEEALKADVLFKMKRGDKYGQSRGGSGVGNAPVSSEYETAINSLLTKDQINIKNAFKTKPQQDKYVASILTPDSVKKTKDQLAIQNAQLTKQIRENDLKLKTENNPIERQKLQNSLVLQTQQMIENEGNINLYSQMLGGETNPEGIKQKYSQQQPEPKIQPAAPPPIERPKIRSKKTGAEYFVNPDGTMELIK